MTALQLRQKQATVLENWKKKLEERDKETNAEKRTALSGEITNLMNEHNSLSEEIRQADAFEAAEKANAGDHLQNQDRRGARNPLTEEEKVAKRFSLLRAAQNVSTGKKQLEGVEQEMYDEAEIEAKRSGVSLSGEIRVPSFLMKNEKRDLTAGTASQGGNTIQTNMGELIDILMPRLVTQQLGATVLSGLVGNLDLPRKSGRTAAVWEGENTAADEQNVTFDKVSLTPKRLAAFVDISKQWMVQTSTSAENLVRQDMNFAVREAVDLAAINGAGTGGVPLGILGTAGTGNVAIGTNGGAPTWAHLISLWREIAIDNADLDMLNYLTTPGIAAQLMQTEKAASTAQYIWTTNSRIGSINGYGATASTLVPSNLAKGTSSDCNAIIFGNWRDLLIGQWAGLDITVDIYTGAKNALVTLVVNSYWDIQVRYPQSFAAIRDARVTI